MDKKQVTKNPIWHSQTHTKKKKRKSTQMITSKSQSFLKITIKIT